MTRRHRRAIDEFRVFSKTPFAGQGISGLDVPAPIFSAPLSDPDNPLLTLYGGPLTMVRATTALRFDGVKYVAAANNILRIEKGVGAVTLGALIEGQRTFDELLRTDTSQDQLANWTSTGIIDSFDVDADSYGGNRWTLAADGSDRVFVQTITIAAATRSLAFYVRRSDGGVVDGTFCLIYREGSDRTTTYTHIGGNVYKVQEANFTGSAGAAATGLKVKANKTVQLVAPMGLEDGAFSSSAIPTVAAAVTRNADVLTFPTAGNIDGTVGSVVFGVDFNYVGDSNYTITDNTQLRLLIYGESEDVRYYDGTQNPIFQGGAVFSIDTSYKLGQVWSGVLSSGYLDGATLSGSPAIFDGDFNFGASMRIGARNNGAGNVDGHIKGLEIYGVELSSAQMIAKTS